MDTSIGKIPEQRLKISKAIFDEETGDVAYVLEGVKEIRAEHRALIEASQDIRDALRDLLWSLNFALANDRHNPRRKRRAELKKTITPYCLAARTAIEKARSNSDGV